MKKSHKLLVATILCLSVAFGLAACGNFNKTEESADEANISVPAPIEIKTETKKVSVKEVYAMSALSSATYLSENTVAPQSSAAEQPPVTPPPAETRPEEINEDAPRLKSYLQMFEGIILGNGLGETLSTPTAEDGEYATYAYKMTVVLPLASGGNVTYVMYYDETPVEANSAPLNAEDDDDDDDDDVDEDEEDEQEVSTTLSGVLVVGEEVFDVLGEKVVETEGTETETEIEFTTKSRTNPSDYIVVKQEIELGEVEYEYLVYRNGTLAEKTEVERESEDGKEEFEVKFVSLSATGVSSVAYSIEKSEAKPNSFLIKYTSGTEVKVVEVTVENETYTFTYHNGYTEDID